MKRQAHRWNGGTATALVAASLVAIAPRPAAAQQSDTVTENRLPPQTIEGVPPRSRARRRNHTGRGPAFVPLGVGMALGFFGYLVMTWVAWQTNPDPLCGASAGGYLPVAGPVVGLIAARGCPNYDAVVGPDVVSLALQLTSVVLIGAGIHALTHVPTRTAIGVRTVVFEGGARGAMVTFVLP